MTTRRGTWLALLLMCGATTRATAQSAGAGYTSPVPGACWRVQFAPWVPALDWSGSGHSRDVKTVDGAVRRMRDSLFDRDTVAARSNTMAWDSTARGVSLTLYPPWWPAGVSIAFDSVTNGNAEMAGNAVALVADGARPHSRARARVWRVPCG